MSNAIALPQSIDQMFQYNICIYPTLEDKMIADITLISKNTKKKEIYTYLFDVVPIHSSYLLRNLSKFQKLHNWTKNEVFSWCKEKVAEFLTNRIEAITTEFSAWKRFVLLLQSQLLDFSGENIVLLDNIKDLISKFQIVLHTKDPKSISEITNTTPYFLELRVCKEFKLQFPFLDTTPKSYTICRSVYISFNKEQQCLLFGESKDTQGFINLLKQSKEIKILSSCFNSHLL